MDLTQLKTLIHVAELGSLSKAADRLHIAQPALSRQIGQLERELGAHLFERHGRGMKINDLGQEVLEHAARILEEMESIRSAVAGGNTAYRGTVVVGTTPTVAEIITVPLVTRLNDAHPDLGIRFASAFSGYLLDWLQRGELDLSISYDPNPLHTVRIEPVMMESLMVVGPRDSDLSLNTPMAFSALADRRMILPSSRHGLRTIMNECARQAQVKLHTPVEADSFGAMIDLVTNGFGWTALPLGSIYAKVKDGSLRAAPLVDPTPMRKLVIAFQADRKVSPAARFVGDTFREIAADLIGKKIWNGHML